MSFVVKPGKNKMLAAAWAGYQKQMKDEGKAAKKTAEPEPKKPAPAKAAAAKPKPATKRAAKRKAPH